MLRLTRRSSFLPFALSFASLVVAACGSSKSEDDGVPTDAGAVTVDDTGVVVPPIEDSAVVQDTQSGTPDTGTPLTLCTKGSECPSNVCDESTGKCLDASCKDGTRNQDETDIDCGGTICGKCDIQELCALAEDCTSGVCILQAGVRKCQQPACDDGVKNGDETGLDCGGTCGKCDDGVSCLAAGDCKSDVCSGGKCLTPSCDDGAKNGTDTDIDCGGSACPRCADDKMCLAASDCQSGVCTGGLCQAPKDSDTVKNGTETDTDCGGAGNKACEVGKKCAASSDCKSSACNYNNVCVVGRSCTGHYGGDTCGFGGEGSVGSAQWEDCCATAPLTASGKTVSVGKYQVTAGRMRTFLESINYNVRGFVQQKRDVDKTMPKLPLDATRYVLESAWDMYLPTSFAGTTGGAELTDCLQKDYNTAAYPQACIPGTAYSGVYSAVAAHLGGTIFRSNQQTQTGCFAGTGTAYGTHAFRFPEGYAYQAPEIAPQASQEVYDTKAIQCVDYLVAEAFCVWDGGRLESLPEWQAAWGAGALPWSATSTAIPQGHSGLTYWGCRFPWATDDSHPGCTLNWSAPNSIEYDNFKYSYEFPKLAGTDYIMLISAPGRTRGRGPGGHADVVGNLFEITSSVSYNASPFSASHKWSGNGSWEGHGYNKNGNGGSMLLNKYGKLGLRCAYP